MFQSNSTATYFNNLNPFFETEDIILDMRTIASIVRVPGSEQFKIYLQGVGIDTLPNKYYESLVCAWKTYNGIYTIVPNTTVTFYINGIPVTTEAKKWNYENVISWIIEQKGSNAIYSVVWTNKDGLSGLLYPNGPSIDITPEMNITAYITGNA